LKRFDMGVYTRRRIKELRGEKIYNEEIDDEVDRYIKRRLAELRKRSDRQSELDNSRLGCYTVSTMGDRDGET
jgi:hypothetical protein